jgi:signal peptidase II
MQILQKPWFKTFQIVILVLLDQWTKMLAKRDLQFAPPQVYLDGFFRLEYAENSGAFLSLGSKLPQEVRFWIFIVAVGAFLLGALYYLYFDKKLDRTTLFSLAIIVGGGIGNLIDRIFRPNHGVVDFLNVGFGAIRTGIFNIADMAIMLGVILLFYKSLNSKKDTTN